MRNAELIHFDTDAELANAVARAWLDEVAAARRTGKPYCVALSGGRITLKFFAAVIEQSKARDLSFAGVDFFWADERCVPPDHAESSFAAADKFFFQPLGIAADRIHRIRGEASPQEAAQHAEAELCRIAPLNADGQPVLDLIFLGMGEDGHVASLFPGEPEKDLTDKAVYRVVRNSPKPPPIRITLGYAAIAAARQVWVLASGDGKETALRESLKPDGQTPLARVLRSHPLAKVFTDIRWA
jgi:6-phosphogluconolactonase